MKLLETDEHSFRGRISDLGIIRARPGHPQPFRDRPWLGLILMRGKVHVEPICAMTVKPIIHHEVPSGEQCDDDREDGRKTGLRDKAHRGHFRPRDESTVRATGCDRAEARCRCRCLSSTSFTDLHACQFSFGVQYGWALNGASRSLMKTLFFFHFFPRGGGGLLLRPCGAFREDCSSPKRTSTAGQGARAGALCWLGAFGSIVRSPNIDEVIALHPQRRLICERRASN